MEGEPATEETAEQILGPLESPYCEGTKHVLGFEVDGKLIAVTEVLEGYPSVHEWYIGLLLVAPEERRKGIGSHLCARILAWMTDHQAATVRAVVQVQNAGARTFWERQGFVLEREVVKRTGLLEGRAWILARRVQQNS